MRIQLKQNEIEEAIKGFLTRQGIAVTGKDINMLFTSGRKNNGLSVEVVIEDAVQPSMSETLATTLEVQDGQLTGSDNLTSVAEPEATERVEPTEPEEPAAEVKPAGSLFS